VAVTSAGIADIASVSKKKKKAFTCLNTRGVFMAPLFLPVPRCLKPPTDLS